jgi:type I restriction enzyme S subunit
MSEWKEYRLGELGKIITGKTPSTKDSSLYDGHIPFICIPDLGESKRVIKTNKTITSKGANTVKNLLLPANSVVVSCIATIGKVGITSTTSLTNQQINSIIPIPSIVNSDFLYYLLKNSGDKIGIYGGGGSVFNIISKSKFSEITFSIPSLPTQTAIAEILSSLDDKIELNNKINHELETLAQTLFKQWFIDFEFPNENGEPYKSSGGQMVDSELGEIPEGWEVGLLNKIASLDRRNIKPYENPEKQYFHYSLPDFDNGKKPSITNGKEILSSKYKITPFSILVSKLNPRIPRVWIITNCNENSICSTEFQVIKPKKIEYFSFICTLCSSNTFFDSLKSKVTGTSSSHQRVNPNDIINYKFPIPKDDILLKFDSIISDIFNKKNNNIIENNSLILTRDTLLPKLISGELEINEISK